MTLSLALALTALAAAPGPMQQLQAGWPREPHFEALLTHTERLLDFDELTRRAVGESWQKASPAQRQQVTASFKALLHASYARQAAQKGTLAVELQWGDEKLGADEASVRCALNLNGGIANLEFRFWRGPHAWRLYDVLSENVSLVASWHEQFRGPLAKGGPAALVAALDTRRSQLEPAPALAPAVPARADSPPSRAVTSAPRRPLTGQEEAAAAQAAAAALELTRRMLTPPEPD